MSAVDIPRDLLARARLICLALPDATEQETWGHPTFRVRDKIFASIGVEDVAGGRCSMTMKAPPGEQDLLLATGHPFFYPAYVGVRGWIGIYVDARTDWTEVAELVEDSYRMTATKRQIARLDAGLG